MDTVDDIISDLQSTQEALATEAPIAAKPMQLREQIDTNNAIIADLDAKMGELELVHSEAEKMINEAEGMEDDSIAGRLSPLPLTIGLVDLDTSLI